MKAQLRRRAGAAAVAAAAVVLAGCGPDGGAADDPAATASAAATTEAAVADGVPWDQMDGTVPWEQVAGYDDWVAGTIDLGYGIYGFDLDHLPDDYFVDWGVGFCQAVATSDGGAQALLDGAYRESLQPGVPFLLTSDYTIDMFAAHVGLAMHTLCPELEQPYTVPGSGQASPDGYEQTLAGFLEAWAGGDVAGMAALTQPAGVDQVLGAAENNPLADGQSGDCTEDHEDASVTCYVETTAGSWGMAVQLRDDGAGYQVFRLLPADVG